ncbi:MAG: ATP-binding protein [Nanopusillaceae archaeon]
MLLELLPRVGAPKPPASVFGSRFTLCIASDLKKLHVFVETSVSMDTLKNFFGVSRASYDSILQLFSNEIHVSEARLKNSFDFWFTDIVVSDIPGLVNSLEAVGGVCVGVSRDPGLRMVFAGEVSKLMSKSVRYNNQAYREKAKLLRNRVNKVVLGKILILAPDKNTRKYIEKLVESSCSARLSWERRKIKKAGDLEKLLQPPRMGFLERLIGERNRVVFVEDTLHEIIKLPDPSLHKIGFVRGSPLPLVIPERTGEKSFRIGVLEDGREFRLSVEDMFRHVYVIGQTGSGKTSFIKLLVHRLKELGEASIVVVDPHGDMAKELAEEIPEALYLHPIKSPFGLNPLDLPRTEDRDHAITIAIDILLEMFKEVLKLMETAVNVKYLLQVILRALYSKSDSPTMADLYNVILALYKGELDLDIDDAEWQAQLEALQNMQDQTFISALSRLEAYAHDKLLLRLTSKTTIDVDKLLSPGSFTVFSIPKADLGENLARLVASTIVMKLWFEALARARLNKPRTPVFLVIDEFQFVADLPIIDTILSEARKYGLHLVIAHQHTEQIPQTLLQSILTNCAVKVAFMVGGSDIKRLSMMDASFADALAKALTGLTIGRAVVKVTARPGEQQPPPVIVSMDYIQHEVKRSNIYTNAYDPGETARHDLKSMMNPVLKYIDPVRPLELFALYEVWRAKRIALTDLAIRLGAPRKDVEDAVSRLSALGYIEVEREGNRKVLVYVKGLFKGLRKVAPGEEGYRIAKRVVSKYYSKGYTALPAKQGPQLKSRPDIVAIPVDRATWRPRYSEAIAVEVESCNELETHPEHVVRNWLKESVKDFAEVHSWADEKCFERLRQLYERHGEVHGKVKVFSVKLAKKPEEPATGAVATAGYSVGSGGSATKAVADGRARVVEVRGRRYRVVFKSVEDAERFDRLSSARTSVELRGNTLRVVRERVTLAVFDLEVAEEL